MRTLLIALMIALLPLRGWVGDAMAMEMVTATGGQSVSAIKSEAHHDYASRATAYFDTENAMPADCPEHAAAHDDQKTDAASHCDRCSTCQICHALALTATSPHMEATTLPAVPPQTTAPQFASAERAPGFKPPIF